MKSVIGTSVDVLFVCNGQKDTNDGLKIKETLHNLLAGNQDYIDSKIVISDSKSAVATWSTSKKFTSYVLILSIDTNVDADKLPDEILCLLTSFPNWGNDGSSFKGVKRMYANIRTAFDKHISARNITSEDDLVELIDKIIMGNETIDIALAINPSKPASITGATKLSQ